MAHTLVSIQIIPRTPDGKDIIPYVDRAIEIIDQAGVPYRVGPLETTMEGELPELLRIIEQMNAEMVKMEAASILSQVKILHQPDGISISELTQKYDQRS
ncbi:thiamine-binding protein [Thermoactinomyces mirandus]|uniref:Thiamine-binding protein n=1 Tax=Thermoactinomyces mirandus TaxID=2756294 RepID=A0A7W2ASU4_9BACL|nr:thiamine-binding protein [Thermoactinomyces mirandus]MBA4603050.1 thiamine-binding protein [Thermoactinomyces mirandus]